MEIVIIDLSKIEKADDFYDQLLQQVPDFGDFFGRNLNAFWDYIGLLGGKNVVFINSQYLKKDIFLFIKSIMEMIHESNVNSIRLKLPNDYLISLSFEI